MCTTIFQHNTKNNDIFFLIMTLIIITFRILAEPEQYFFKHIRARARLFVRISLLIAATKIKIFGNVRLEMLAKQERRNRESPFTRELTKVQCTRSYVRVRYMRKSANADGIFVETPNKKLAFTSAPRGRVLIRITRVRLLYGPSLVGSLSSSSCARSCTWGARDAGKRERERVETHRKGA